MKKSLSTVISLLVCLSYTTGLCFVSHSPQLLETGNWKLETDVGSPLWKGGGGNAAGGLSLTYDALGQVAKVAQTVCAPSGEFLSVYKYDALGNRVVADTKLWIPNHSDALKRPVIECNELGEIIRYYIWGDNRLLGFIDSNGILTIAHCDDFGSVIALTDLSGTPLYSANYGPHGEDWGSTGFNPTPFTWLGGYGVYTLETGTPLKLYLTRYRVYSATLNRFLSSDPMGLEGGLNLYAYGNGNPMAYIDPLGLCGQSVWGAFWEGFGEGWRAGWEINFNTLSLGMTDSLGWTDSGRHEGTMYDVSRGLAAVGTLALAQAGALAVTEVAGTALVNWGAGAAGAAAAGSKLWTPVNGPGPLGEKVASTFRSATYLETTVSEATTLYRSYGGTAQKLGSYWTRIAPTGPLQATFDSALNPAWGNTATRMSTIQIPTGTKIFEGFSAQQGTLFGGGNQIYIPTVNPQWLLP